MENGEFFVWVIFFVVLMFVRWIEIYFFLCRRFIEDSKDKWVIDKGYVIMYMCFSFLRIILLIVLFFILFCFDIWGINDIYDVFMNLINIIGFFFLNCIEINIMNKNINIIVFCLEEGIFYWLVIGLFLVYIIVVFLIMYFGVLVCRLWM